MTDYTIDVVGNLTSINPVLSGGLNVGDIAIVSYDFITDPTATIGRTTFHAGAGWDVGWLAVAFDHDQTNEDVLSGTVSTAQDTQRDSLRFDLRHELQSARLSGNLSLVRDQTSIVEYDEITLGQTFTWKLSRAFEWLGNSRQSWREFKSPDRSTQIVTADTALIWRHRLGHTARLFFRFRDLDDTTSLDQQDIEIGIRARFRFGKLEIDPLLRWAQNRRGSTTSTDLRGFLSLRRRF
jgi:hypothetical protein